MKKNSVTFIHQTPVVDYSAVDWTILESYEKIFFNVSFPEEPSVPKKNGLVIVRRIFRDYLKKRQKKINIQNREQLTCVTNRVKL